MIFKVFTQYFKTNQNAGLIGLIYLHVASSILNVIGPTSPVHRQIFATPPGAVGDATVAGTGTRTPLCPRSPIVT